MRARPDPIGMVGEIPGIEKIRERVVGGLHLLDLDPDPPRKVREEDSARGEQERPVLAAASHGQSRQDRHQREHLTLVLRERAGGEEERRCREHPLGARAQPGREGSDPQRNEHRQGNVGVVRLQLVDERRCRDERQERRGKQDRPRRASEQRPRATDESDREAEQLQMDEGAVERRP